MDIQNKNEYAIRLFKALGDESRLRIVQMLLRDDSYVELIASRLNLTSATVSHHLKKLEEAGLVECSRTQFYMIYRLNRAVLSDTIESLVAAEKEIVDDDTAYREKIIGSFIVNDRLTNLPAQRKKREIILRYIAESFPKKESYTEKEVNENILRFNEDYCTIRREMISFGIMKRENGTYWLL